MDANDLYSDEDLIDIPDDEVIAIASVCMAAARITVCRVADGLLSAF